MTAITLRRFAVSAVVVTSMIGGFGVAIAADEPYVVRGNSHVILGVTLDEAAVRAVLPPGIEPTEGITGGYNLYRSAGGYNTPAYTRAYVWADVEGHDGADGAKGRWLIWGVSANAEAGRASGFNLFEGGTSFVEHGVRITATARQGDVDIIRAKIELADSGCAPGAGALNYPVKLPTGILAVHHIPYAGDFCGATPLSLDVLVGDDHQLAKFKPASVVWAVQAKNLSFAVFTRELE